MALSRFEDLTTEQLERTYRTNVFAMFWLCRFALAHMEPGSCIINTSSIQEYQPSPHLIDYAPTKAAIANFTRTWLKSSLSGGSASIRWLPVRSGRL
jgi:NAD(P)-dependent dehydrogenase (short-subunit alcohol dehydrogenase family)